MIQKPVNPWDDPTYNPNPLAATGLPGTPVKPPGLQATGIPSAAPGGQPGVETTKKVEQQPAVLNAAPAGAGAGATPLGEPPAPTVLSDGQGGSVPVPPAAIAPPGVVPQASVDPWNAQTFGADSNVINTQIAPGAAPDRNKMALDQYNTWDEATAPQFAHDITDATDAAAAHGQIRSGQLTNKYGDLSRQRALDSKTARNSYMQNALDSSITDARSNRGEQRTERGYQRGLAEQAIARRIAQSQAEGDQALTQFKAGNSMPDPTGALTDASAQAGAESQQSSSDMAALIRAWLARNQQAAA